MFRFALLIAALAWPVPLLAGPGPGPTPTPRNAAQMTPAEAEALVKEVTQAVERIRRLRFKTPVQMQIIDSAKARSDFASKLDERVLEAARHEQRAYAQLGLIPPRTDIVDEFLKGAETDVLGYYEDGTQTFYLLSHVSAEDARAVIAHELTHALEDQHYDLAAVARKAGGDDDRSTAITAVVEGSAMTVMLAYLTERVGLKEAAQAVKDESSRRVASVKRAPSFTQRSLMLPYALGMTFLLRGKPWEFFYDGVRLEDIRTAYAEPPRSTQQILHPDSYWVGRARPQSAPLTLPDLSAGLGPGWSKVAEGSIGELGVGVMAGASIDLDSPEVIMPSHWTNKAATGLLGDRFHHYANGEKRATLLATRWETEDDVAEFQQALSTRGRQFFRYGTNALVLAGDVGDAAQAVAMAALQRAQYWNKD